MTIGQLLGAATGKPSRHPYPQHMREARAIAAEGVVLLKNEGSVLPLPVGRVCARLGMPALAANPLFARTVDCLRKRP